MPAPLSASPAPAAAAAKPEREALSWSAGLLWVSLLSAALFFGFLASRPLSNPDEGRYSEIPREMLATGDFVTPRLDGVKYFEKPPLVYWLNAGAQAVFGPTEFAARFWVAVFAVAGCALTYGAGRALHGTAAGLASAGVLATSFLYYALSRVVLLDLVVTVWIGAALFAFILAVRRPPGETRRWLFWAFYASMALATLTKGLIGFVLPCGIVGAWLVVARRWSSLRPLHPVTGGLLFLAIALPWHVLAARANPEFAQFYFIHEHFQRFATTVHGRVEPFWFFAPVFLGGLFPWVGFLPSATQRAFVTPSQSPRNDTAWFLGIWIFLIFAFFSVSQSKLIPYLLPVFPAAALLLGRHVSELWMKDARTSAATRAALGIAAGILVLLGLALLVAKLPSSAAGVAAALRPMRVVLALPLLVGAGFCLRYLAKGAFRPAVICLAAGWALFLAPANRVGGYLDARSTKTLAAALAPKLQPEDIVYCVGEYFQDFPFYLGRLVDVVGYEGELAFGIHAEPGRTASRFIGREAFFERWQHGPRSYALVKRRDAPDWFSALPQAPAVVAESSRYLLLTNQAR
ncbi:hypothetical protein DB347_07635 [Opitutaceae bacterium EW11]|nr:hypothetical protein DB347_07635 [Opitutaceae bacterium EW11]